MKRVSAAGRKWSVVPPFAIVLTILWSAAGCTRFGFQPNGLGSDATTEADTRTTDGGVDVGEVDLAADWGADAAPDVGGDAEPDADSECLACPQIFTLGSQSDLVLAAYLSAEGAAVDRPIRVVIPSDVVVGTSDPTTAAIASGDLSSYAEVILEISGEVQGAGGAPNGGAGGDAINLSSAVGIRITSTGAIRGGGGGGGRGGVGGAGSDRTSNWVSRTASVYGADQVDVAWYRSPDDTNCGVRDFPDNYRTTFPCSRWSSTLFDFDTDQITQKGGYWRDTGLGWEMYHFSIAFHGSRSGGAGGHGGYGRGFEQLQTNGNTGVAGQLRSGDGGRGGDGGDWGSPGGDGATGATGLRYTYQTTNAADGGDAGGAGGPPGNAIRCDGLSIPLQNDGVLSGNMSCEALPLAD